MNDVVIKDSKKTGYALIMTTVIIWGIDTILFKILLEDISPLLSVYIRYIVLLLAMQTIVYVFEDSPSYNQPKTKYYKRTILGMGLSAVLFYVINMSGLSIASATVTDFISTALNSLAIILLLALTIKRERKTLFNKFTILSLLIAIVGVYFAAVGIGGLTIDKGALLVISSSIFWGIYTALFTRFDHSVSIIKINRDLSIIAVIFLTVVVFINGEFTSFMTLNPVTIAKTVIIAMIVDIGTVLTYYKGIRIITGTKASILMLLSPVITYIIAYFYLGERISTMEQIGCALLFLSSIVLVIKELIDSRKYIESFN